MGQFFTLFLSIILLAILAIAISFPASCNEIVSANKASDSHQPTPAAAPAYQVLHIKNTAPFILNTKESDKKRKTRKMKNERSRKGKRKNVKAAGSMPFAVMLPKGSVPPSGSSPCHNDNPDSSAPLFCGFSAAKKP